MNGFDATGTKSRAARAAQQEASSHNKPTADSQAFLLVMGMMYPSNWDQPKIDRGFADLARFFKKKGINRPPYPGTTPRPASS